MKKIFLLILALAGMSAAAIELSYLGGENNLLRLRADHRFLLLPIEDKAPEASLYVVKDNRAGERVQVRLARERIDYYVPYSLEEYSGSDISLVIAPMPEGGMWRDSLRLADEFSPKDCKFRPEGRFAPPYGWMNDPNGMIYHKGEYHLFYQYNPYGCTWGNMSWGHAVSKDLVNWEHLPVALTSDAWGSIFSGSCVQKGDSLFAFYTSAGARQTQSMAYSTDGGRSFTKYAGNPVLTSDIPDFRDPKLIWYEPDSAWIMVVASGQEMRFYRSRCLRQWEYLSSFGSGYGSHGGVWECPDLLRFGSGKNEKWVLICNINPGGPAGGSATQYFTGKFDGRTFTCDSDPKTIKWLDYGKDHYATVSFADAPSDRNIVLAWMSNWQYAGVTPTTHYRSTNSLPRDLSLFEYGGETYVSCSPSPEAAGLKHFDVTLKAPKKSKGKAEIKLSNAAGEYVTLTYDFAARTVTMDRSKGGLTDFSADFAVPTTAPLLCGSNKQKVSLYVSACSVEAFGGSWCMTNLSYPSSPYDRVECSVSDKSIKVEISKK